MNASRGASGRPCEKQLKQLGKQAKTARGQARKKMKRLERRDPRRRGARAAQDNELLDQVQRQAKVDLGSGACWVRGLRAGVKAWSPAPPDRAQHAGSLRGDASRRRR